MAKRKAKAAPTYDGPVPAPGDLIEVVKSEWYAAKDGERVMVAENMGGWCDHGEVFVLPVKGIHAGRPFWGPCVGGGSRESFSVSGGPFLTVSLAGLALERLGTTTITAWQWKDRPRAGGGEDYKREVTLWRLDRLPDRA